jgi:hypothetical protein
VIKKKPSHSRKVVYWHKPDPKMCVHPDGIDLSHHNVAYDWKKVDAKFVYVRATFGIKIKDKLYDIHRKAAERHNIPVGAYHFLTADNTAKDQFKHFSSIVKSWCRMSWARQFNLIGIGYFKLINSEYGYKKIKNNCSGNNMGRFVSWM